MDKQPELKIFNMYHNLSSCQMPWVSLPYDPSKSIALTRIFNVHGQFFHGLLILCRISFSCTVSSISFDYTLSLTSSGIPSLILIDESNRIISRHGRSVLLEDPKGERSLYTSLDTSCYEENNYDKYNNCLIVGVYFPWGARPLQELNEHSVSRLREEPSLILFTEVSCPS